MAPQQGEETRGSAYRSPPGRAKGRLSEMDAGGKRPQEGRYVLVTEVRLIDAEKPPHA